jgi:hypothetical protein
MTISSASAMVLLSTLRMTPVIKKSPLCQRGCSHFPFLQLDRVWNYDFAGRTSIVDLYISYLRKKIDAGQEPMIHTVRGVGYMLRPPA